MLHESNAVFRHKKANGRQQNPTQGVGVLAFQKIPDISRERCSVSTCILSNLRE